MAATRLITLAHELCHHCTTVPRAWQGSSSFCYNERNRLTLASGSDIPPRGERLTLSRLGGGAGRAELCLDIGAPCEKRDTVNACGRGLGAG